MHSFTQISVSLFFLFFSFSLASSAEDVIVAFGDGKTMFINAYEVDINGFHFQRSYTFSAPGLAGSIDMVQKNPNEIDLFYVNRLTPTTYGVRKDRIHMTVENGQFIFNFVGRTNYPAIHPTDPSILDVSYNLNTPQNLSTLQFFTDIAHDLASKKGLPVAFNPTGPFHKVFDNPTGTVMTGSCVSEKGEYAAETFLDQTDGYFAAICPLDHGICKETPKLYHLSGAPISLDCSDVVNHKIFLIDEEIKIVNGHYQGKTTLIPMTDQFVPAGSSITLAPFTPLSDSNAFRIRFDSVNILNFLDQNPPFWLTVYPKQLAPDEIQLLFRATNPQGRPIGPAKSFLTISEECIYAILRMEGDSTDGGERENVKP